jgi:lysophospholipase L1-like esterase
MKGTVSRGILALSLAVLLFTATAASPAQGASPGGLYVALGDSVAATPWRPPAGSYVDRLFLYYQSTLGVTQLSNRAQGGETSSSIRTGGQLDSALADINAASDTRAVTIDIGGNDALNLLCRGRTASGRIGPIWDSCPYRYNFFATLTDLRAALDSDPGSESFAAMAYYNPASGTGDGDGRPYSEPIADRGLLGTDLAIDCETTAGTRVGLNDVIYQEAGRRGLLVADPYLAFKEGGQSFMADDVHPNDAGHAAIAGAFREASAQCPDAGNLLLPTPPPSNEFGFGKVKKNKRKGTAKLTVGVPGPGELELAKTKSVNADEESAESAGKDKLSIKPKGKARKKLTDKGKAKVKANVTYTPTGGSPNTEDKKIKLVKR